VPRGLRQAIQKGREAFLLGPGATELALMASNVTLKDVSRYGSFNWGIQFITQ